MKIREIFRERDPTQGNIIKNTLGMTNPLWINTGFWIIVHLLNLYFVSRLGIEAIATVAIGGTAFMLLMAPIQGIVTATYGMIGSFNRQDPVGLDRLVKQILSTTWIVSIIIALCGYFLAPVLLGLLRVEPEVISLSVTYLRICAIGGIISFSLWPINGMIRSTRDMFRPMLIMGLVLGLQLFFDYSLILGNFGFPKMGVAGAAISLALSAGIGAGVGFWMLIKGRLFIKINLKNWQDFKIKFKTLKEIFKIAGFDTFEGIGRTIIQMVILGIVAFFGTPALAAFSIGQRLFKYALMPGMDLGTTTAITVSNNLKTGSIKRAERSSWMVSGLNVLIMGIVGLVLFIFANQIIGIFSQAPEVLTVGVNYLRITIFGYIFFAAGIILRRAFAGAKDTKTPMIVYFGMAGLQIGLALVLSKFFGFGINGVWIAILAGMIFYGSAMAGLFKKGYWKPKKTI